MVNLAFCVGMFKSFNRTEINSSRQLIPIINIYMLLTDRQAKNAAEADTDEVQKAAAVESNTERSVSIEENLAAEDTEPVEDSAKAESEDDAVEKEVGLRNSVQLLCLTLSGFKAIMFVSKGRTNFVHTFSDLSTDIG